MGEPPLHMCTNYNVTRRRVFDDVVDRDESDKRASPGMAWHGKAWMCTSGTSRKGGREGHGRDRERLLSAWMANCIHNHGAEEGNEEGAYSATCLDRSYSTLSTNVRRETVSVEFLLF